MKNRAIPEDRGAAPPSPKTPPAIPFRLAGALILLLPIILHLLAATEADARPGWYPAAGATWAFPTDSAVSDLYDSGPGAMAGLGYNLADRIRLEMRFDWLRRTAYPPHQLADHAESRLTLTPFSLEAHLRIRRDGVTPYVLAGPSLVFSQERIRYTLLGRDREATGRRSDYGAVLGGGIEVRRGDMRGRLALRALIAGGNREVLRVTGRTDARSESASASHWTLGLEVQPW